MGRGSGRGYVLRYSVEEATTRTVRDRESTPLTRLFYPGNIITAFSDAVIVETEQEENYLFSFPLLFELLRNY